MLKFLRGQRVCWLLAAMGAVCGILALINDQPAGSHFAAMGGWMYAALSERDLAIARAAS